VKQPPLPDKPVVTDPNVDPDRLQLRLRRLKPRRVDNEATTMKTNRNFRSVERFSMDEGASDAPPPPRKQSNAQQCAPGYLWNSTTQELIPILPEDHPDYRHNEEIIAAAIRRWNGVRR
jgi:hypothetical protein